MLSFGFRFAEPEGRHPLLLRSNLRDSFPVRNSPSLREEGKQSQRGISRCPSGESSAILLLPSGESSAILLLPSGESSAKIILSFLRNPFGLSASPVGRIAARFASRRSPEIPFGERAPKARGSAKLPSAPTERRGARDLRTLACSLREPSGSNRRVAPKELLSRPCFAFRFAERRGATPFGKSAPTVPFGKRDSLRKEPESLPEGIAPLRYACFPSGSNRFPKGRSVATDSRREGA